MLRSVGQKVAWVGRTASMVLGLALVLALLFGVATMAFAANGNNFVLGVLNNTATDITRLVGNVPGGPALQVVNPNTGAGSKALQLSVAEDKAPLTVNATAGKATNLDADKLDNRDSNSFANATHQHSGVDITSGTVAEARIDSAIARDSEVSNGFIQGGGSATRGAAAVNPGQFLVFLATPDFRLSYSCPASDITNNNGILRIRNLSTTETVNLFSDNGGTNPNHYGSLNTDDGSPNDPDSKFDQFAAASGEFVTFGVQGSYVATIQAFSVHRASDNRCHIQGQALITR